MPKLYHTNTQTGTCNEQAGNRTLTGNLTVNGDLTIDGDFTIAADLVVNGLLTITGDIVAYTGGSITVGDGGVIDVVDDFRPNSGLSTTFSVVVEDGGSFFVGDDFDGTNLSGVDIQDGGNMDVGGNFTSGVGTTTNIDGNMNVDGDFTNESFIVDAILEGDGDLTVGGTYTNNGNDDDFGGSFNGAPLPVELIYFSAELVNGGVLLRWKTSLEINNEGFELERSGNGENFTKIGWMNGFGNSEVEREYSFADRNPYSGTSYYRLRQLDFDGKYEYSSIVRIDGEVIATTLEVYPNPTFGSIRILSDLSEFQLYDPSGKLVLDETGISRENAERIISNHLKRSSAGVYTLTAKIGDSVDQIRLVKK